MQLQDLRALVTGGASGMGRAFVEQLHAAGARVAFCDLDAAKVQQTASELGPDVLGICANVAVESDVDALFTKVLEGFGGLDLLVNNAGITRDGLLVRRDKQTGHTLRFPLSDWQAVIDVNLTGPFLCARAGCGSRTAGLEVSPERGLSYGWF